MKTWFKDLFNRITLKELILSCLALFAVIITFVGMSFDLVNVVTSHGKYIENGFMLMDFKSFFITSYYNWAIVLLGILNWLQLLVCLASVALIVLSYVNKVFSAKKGLINICVLIACGVFTLLYMAEGIIYTSINNDTLSGDFKTLGFIPLIFTVCTIVAYFVVKCLLKDRPLISAKQNETVETQQTEVAIFEQEEVTSTEQLEAFAVEQSEEIKDNNSNN